MAIHPTAVVDNNAQIGQDVEIGAHCVIGPGVDIGDGCRIDHHVNIERNTKLGPGCRIWPFVSLGTDPQDLRHDLETETYLVIGANNIIREFVTMNRGSSHGSKVTKVGDNGMFMAYSHVAHDCQLGNNIIMANSVNLAGHVTIGDMAGLGGVVAVHQFVQIGRQAFIAGFSAVSQDMPPFTLCEGNRARTRGLNLVGMRRSGMEPSTIEALKLAYRIIFRTRTPMDLVVAQVRGEVPDLPEVREFLEFIQGSTRGVPR